MEELRLGYVEAKFADIIWAKAPIPSGELVKLAKEELGWTKSTTYTVLRRLCERSLFQNEGGLVTALISREDFYHQRSERLLSDGFAGSVPSFLAAFTKRKALTAAQIAEIRRMIDEYEEELP